MSMNTQQARVIDPVLTQTAQGYSHADRIGKESFRKTNARRAPGADTATIQLGYLGEAFALVTSPQSSFGIYESTP